MKASPIEAAAINNSIQQKPPTLITAHDKKEDKTMRNKSSLPRRSMVAAGGNGIRLHTIIKCVSMQLLPVY
jgi:hypothetical protein